MDMLAEDIPEGPGAQAGWEEIFMSINFSPL